MNYADLFRFTAPETALELAALLVLVVDLGVLRKASLNVRVTVAALLGVAGCGVALCAMGFQYGFGLYVDESLVLATGHGVTIAQAGILVLTALTLLLLIGSDFTRHVVACWSPARGICWSSS
jgi:NADH-quinone oxidoreductase subunit N